MAAKFLCATLILTGSLIGLAAVVIAQNSTSSSSPPCKLSQWWLYYINTPAGQPYNVTALAETNVDYIVLDYLHNGVASKLLSPSDLTQIRNGIVHVAKESKNNNKTTTSTTTQKGFTQKTILAYVGTGEAEIYRYYWNPGWLNASEKNEHDSRCNGSRTAGAPDWLLEPSSESCTLWRIHFWHPQWLTVLNGYIDVLAKAGFDGIYLDNIDAYQWFADELPGAKYRPANVSGAEIAHRMIELLEHIAERGRRINPRFSVFTQNGDVVVQDVISQDWQRRYLTIINGTGVEDIWYRGGPNTENNEAVPVEERIGRLDALKQVFIGNDKIVLSVEYLNNLPKIIDQYYGEACQVGFVPFAARGSLDAIAFPPSQLPQQHEPNIVKFLESLTV